jgi:hypothetical protein
VKRIALALGLLALAAGVTAWRLVDVKPNPNDQARADGCQRNTTSIYTGLAPNWVYVNDKDYPKSGPPPAPRWAEGIVSSKAQPALASRVSNRDDPITHRAYDNNIDLRVTGADDFLTGTSRDDTDAAGTIHMERELGATYPFWAWPAPGDYVKALGSWVWDCDHYQERGEETEFHPFRAIWSDRGVSPHSPTGENEGDLYVSTDATPAGVQAECAHYTKGASTFKECTHTRPEWLSVNGDYAFTLCAHGRRRGKLAWRVVDRGSVSAPPVIVAAGNPGCVNVSFTVTAPDAERVIVAKQVFVGWSDAKPLVHLRLRFDSVLIRRAMDPSAPLETTLGGQEALPPGEWQITWSVAGIWGAWPGTLLAKDGSVFKGRQRVDFYLPVRTPWTLVAEARECDFGAIPNFDGPGHVIQPCPKTNEVGNAFGDDYGGSVVARFASAVKSVGAHATDAKLAGSTCPPANKHGCYQLRYTVSVVR